jgi:hypothetical protein
LAIDGYRLSISTYHQETTNLFTLLKPLARLESLCLHSSPWAWCYDEDDFVDFVRVRGDSLKVLAFFGPRIANGSWESAIKRVVSLPLNNMSLLQFSGMHVPHEDPYDLEADWPQFIERISLFIEESAQYTVYLSSSDGNNSQYIFRPLSPAANSTDVVSRTG